MTVWKFAEWLGLTEAGMRVSEENEWNEQRAATTGQGIVRMLVYCEESLKEKKRSVSLDFSVSFLQVIFRDSCITTCICRTPDIMVQMTSLHFKRKWVPST